MTGPILTHDRRSLQSSASHVGALQPGMLVRCHDRFVGHVLGLAPEWAAQPTHLVVHTGPLVTDTRLLPLSWIAEISADQITLRVRRRNLERIRPIRDDEQIAAEIREALYTTPTFRADDAWQAIEVCCVDHAVTLRGNVRTIWRALLAETIARDVRGVWDMQNQLIGDDELEAAVLRALRQNRRLDSRALRVEARLGHVTLHGRVPTIHDSAAAALHACRVAGAHMVTNRLVIAEESATAISSALIAPPRAARRSAAGGR